MNSKPKEKWKCPYPLHKTRIISGKKCEHPLRPDRDYWLKLCDAEERVIVRVRDQYLDVSFPSLITPLDPNADKRIYKNIPTKDHISSDFIEHKKSALEAFSTKASLSKSTLKRQSSFFENETEPILKVSPPTPVKQPIIESISERNTETTKADDVPIFKDSISKKKNSKNRKQSGDILNKIESTLKLIPPNDIIPKIPCSTHKNEPPVKIFDDNIEKYLFQVKWPTCQGTSPGIARKKETVSATKKKAISRNYVYPTSSEKNFTINATARSTVPKLVKFHESSTDKSLDKSENEPVTCNGEINIPEIIEEEKKLIKNVPAVSSWADKTEMPEKIKKASKKKHSLKYSLRVAYKALKFLTANKQLDFEPKQYDETVDNLCPELQISPKEFVDDQDKIYNDDAKNLESDFLLHRDIQKRLRKEWKRKRNKKETESSDSSNDTIKSIFISSRSRSTSGTSYKFGFPETRKSAAANLLSKIPKMSNLPRRNCDKCLRCLYKPFEKPGKQKTSLPRSTLQRIISPDKWKSVESVETERTESDSTSITLPEIENKLEYTSSISDLPDDRFLPIINFPTKIFDVKEIEISKIINEENVTVQKQDLGITLQQRQFAEVQRPTELNLSPKLSVSPKAQTKSVSIASEKSIQLSSDIPSPDEPDSPSVLIDDQKHKLVAPCHRPTILCPSLEPLRALRYKKVNTMQSRMNEEVNNVLTKEDTLDDDYDDSGYESRTKQSKPVVQDKQTLKQSKDEVPSLKINDTDQVSTKQDGAPRKVLTKGKSVASDLIDKQFLSENRGMLRRGSSCTDIMLTNEFKENLPPSPDSETEEPPEKIDVVESTIRDALSRGSTSYLTSKLSESQIQDLIETCKNIIAKNGEPMDTLNELCNEFSSRVLKHFSNTTNKDVLRCNEITKKIMKLLLESKKYLFPDKFKSNLTFSSKQNPTCNSRLLRRILPLDSYNLIAPILGMEEWYPLRSVYQKERLSFRKDLFEEKESVGGASFELMVHPPSDREIHSSLDDEKVGEARYNPYALFLKRPRRKVVTWRDLTQKDMEGYDAEATLKMRARNITKHICQDFCVWLKTLGDSTEVVDEEVLMDMFEINFSADAVKTMQVSIMEMPMVPTELALVRNCPSAGELAMTKKHLIRDATAESKPKKISAFGTTLPWELQFLPPNNRVHERWLQCENVQVDLETMDVVWKDITHLESVKGFIKWLREHPEVKPPKALETIKQVDLESKLVEEEAFAHVEVESDQITSLKVE